MEFAFRSNNETWIPLTLIHSDDGSERNHSISIGTKDDLVIRDYRVDNQVIDSNVTKRRMNVNISLEVCNFKEAPAFVQFRWLQTSRVNPNKPYRIRDIWGLDDMKISYVEENKTVVLVSDSFEDEQLK